MHKMGQIPWGGVRGHPLAMVLLICMRIGLGVPPPCWFYWFPLTDVPSACLESPWFCLGVQWDKRSLNRNLAAAVLAPGFKIFHLKWFPHFFFFGFLEGLFVLGFFPLCEVASTQRSWRFDPKPSFIMAEEWGERS